MLLSGGRGSFLALSAAGQAKGGRGYITTHVWIPADHRGAVLGAFKAAELALLNKGLISAFPSRVGNMENPTFFFKHIFSYVYL